MGNSKPVAPSISVGEFKIGDKTVSKTYYDSAKNTYVNQYIPDEEELNFQGSIKQKLSSLLSSLGFTSNEQKNELDSIEQAYINDGTTQFMKQYEPQLKNLRENIASRFGSLNSSDFADRLSNLENARASALSDIINKAQLYKNDIYNSKEKNKIDGINTLSGLMNSDTNQILAGISASMKASDYVNQLLQKNYQDQLSQWESDKGSKLFWFS